MKLYDISKNSSGAGGGGRRGQTTRLFWKGDKTNHWLLEMKDFSQDEKVGDVRPDSN